jgi:PQQ-dependent dehydrogenase (methanol/ethanol family)
VDTANVGRLGMAWTYDLGSYERVEATPIVVGGVMFVTGPWSVVHAVDATSGARIWSYDPRVPRRTGTRVCCGAVNRGVAVYQGRVYVGTLDGRLIALDAGTGARVWEVQTTDTTAMYSITGAPRAGRGLVYIGNGGAEFGVRGYVSAYDAATGALRWRVYIVPGDPTSEPESPALRAAARTWTGPWWTYGGGGTVWDAIVLDSAAERLYVGTGNGSPWLRTLRSPGGGDNLYLASILALDAATGAQLWHYQTVPGESWDFTATQPLVLAEVEVDGARRSVVMQAPKNGFFYVLDRQRGVPLKALPLAPVTWALGIDSLTWRPIENPATALSASPVAIRPSPSGTHNWHPMAWNPDTRLMYLTVSSNVAIMAVDTTWRHDPRQINRGILLGPTGDPEGSLGSIGDETLDMVAWDPVRGRAAWRVRHQGMSAAGVLSVAGGLVFVGRIPRRLTAYRARDGAVLWEHDTGAGVEAAPITYAVDGVQYVAVLVGNSVPSSQFREASPPPGFRGRARIVAFALDRRTDDVPQRDAPPHLRPDIAPDEFSRIAALDLRDGNRLYDKYCVRCHGPAAASRGPAPDLRHSSRDVRNRFGQIVLEGLEETGMPSFAGQLSDEEVRRLQAYIVARARLLMR